MMFIKPSSSVRILVGHHIWAVAVLLSLWGLLLATSAPTGWWTWIARTLPEDAEMGEPHGCVIQLSIALGSTAGGLVFDGLGWRSAFGLSGLLLLGAVAMTCATSRQNRKAQ